MVSRLDDARWFGNDFVRIAGNQANMKAGDYVRVLHEMFHIEGAQEFLAQLGE